MKDLYTENYKASMKEIEADTNKWKDISCSWIGSITTVKNVHTTQMIYGFNAIPIKIPMPFFFQKNRTILKVVWKHKDPK